MNTAIFGTHNAIRLLCLNLIILDFLRNHLRNTSSHLHILQFWPHQLCPVAAYKPMAQRLGTRSLPSYLLPRDTLLLRATKNREVLFYYGATPAETSAVYQVRVYSAAVGLGLTSGRIAKSILFNRSISTGTLRTGKSARTLLFRRQRRSYSSTNPNPPSGARNTSASSDRPARVVLIGQQSDRRGDTLT